MGRLSDPLHAMPTRKSWKQKSVNQRHLKPPERAAIRGDPPPPAMLAHHQAYVRAEVASFLFLRENDNDRNDCAAQLNRVLK